MPSIEFVQGYDTATLPVFPIPVIATRAPASTETNFPLGQLWVRRDTAQVYILAQLASGIATWTLASPGASDVDTLQGDSGGQRSPTGGNIVIAGGTNVTTAGAASTITINLDPAISLATSVTSPLYTTAAGTDMAITSAAGQDIIIKMGDAAGANKVSFVDSADVEVAAIDSNGGFSMGAITFTGLLTASASATIETAGTALNLGSDNSGDAVNIGVGNVARIINIGTTAATAHVINIGNASAGAISLDSGAAISLDAAAASNFSVSGAGIDLSLVSADGRVIINADEAADNAITLLSSAGGIDADCALQLNLASSEAAADAIVIDASAGGMDISTGGGDLDLDSSAAISLDAAAASNFSVSGAGIDLTLASAAGRVVINGEEAADNAITIVSAAGGVDVDAALQLNLASSEAAADAIVINASDAAGGIDISTGGGDLDVTGGADINVDAVGQIQINSSASTIDIGNDADAQNMNIGTGAASRTITIGNTTGTSGLVFQAGSGEMTFTGTVKEINAEFLFSSGTDLVVSQSPIMQSNAATGAAPTGGNGDVNLMYMQDGALMEQFIIGTQTIIAPRMTANGLDIALDNTNAEGAEYNFGARSNSKHVFTIGTDAAFFAEATFWVEDLSGCTPLMMGFRKVEANNAVISDYTDYAAIGLYSVTSATNAVILSELNAGGQTATDTTDAWGGDMSAQKVGIFVSSAGVVSFQVGGSAATAAPAFTFDAGDEVMFFIHFLNGADVAGEVALADLKIGYQA